PAPTPAPKAGAKSKPPPAPEEKIAEPTPPAPEPVAPPPTPKPAPVAQPAPKPAPVKEPVPAREPAQPKVAAIDPPAPKPAAGPNRLVLRFEQDAWAEVTDAAGRNLVSSLNLAGTERVVRGAPPFNLVIGNAQHVKVIYNNKEIDLQPYVKVEVARFTIK
ncbi:MAG TPA: DUF4115 domain-containing protein, partial [Burkholderiales bacterium]|nr:DUF4115 domain-containing protein [Burkholderiales bacterium]